MDKQDKPNQAVLQDLQRAQLQASRLQSSVPSVQFCQEDMLQERCLLAGSTLDLAASTRGDEVNPSCKPAAMATQLEMAAHFATCFVAFPWLREHTGWLLRAAGLGSLYERNLTAKRTGALLTVAYTRLCTMPASREREAAKRKLCSLWQVRTSWNEGGSRNRLA